METAALITAAGMSSRMGDFKPMLHIGSITVAQRVIANLQQAGISKIVMVTGYQATRLERHLSGGGLVFLRNEQYETTEMFDSVRIGLEYLQGKCDRVLFTPVDIPLFTAQTVHALLQSKADLASPSHQGRCGHPILIGSRLIDGLLQDSGENGLKGALGRSGAFRDFVPVNDPGILHDIDTPEDYSALLAYHNSQLVRPQVSAALARETTFFDSQTAMLLALVDETSSVREACGRMQISYSTGWNMIRRLEDQIRDPLILRSQGGSGGSQSVLSPRGRLLLSRFLLFQQELRDAAAQLYEKHFPDLF